MVQLARESEQGVTTEKEWEPRIVALVCNWCTYAGADMAGTTRRIYAPNVRLVRLLCTGRVDPLFLIKTFEHGADGVVVSGCHPGDCHYVQGNLLARRRLSLFRALMDFLGLDNRRLHFAWVSASEGIKWSRIVDQVTAAVREAGPLNHWGKPATTNASGSLLFPAPAEGGGRRPAPPPEENENIAAHLKKSVASLLSEGELSVVIGYSAGSLPGQMVPAFVTNPEEASLLAWNERCANNLTVYLPQAVKRRGKGKVGVVVKSCDAQAVVGLLRENQIKRDEFLLLGVPCAGLWENGRLAPKCFACLEEVSPLADWTFAPDGAKKGVVKIGRASCRERVEIS